MKAIVFGIILFLLAIVAVCCWGCSSANKAAYDAWGKSHHVKQFSGGKLIGEWDSVGKISNEEHSDGYYFQDKVTNKLITISGDVQITVND